MMTRTYLPYYAFIYFIISCIPSLWCRDEHTAYDQELVVVLMVKDEEHVIIPTLEPYVQGGVKNIFIFDTGSTDKTIDNAKQYLNENNITFHIAQEPFIDFATSRNRGLVLAKQKFPRAAFLMMPDAEWYLENVPDLLTFCHEHAHEKNIPCYLMRIQNPGLDFYTARLIRNDSNARFVGVVHEVISTGTKERVPSHIYFRLGSSKRGHEKSALRWLRDRELLLREHKRNPNDPRTAFYLAQTYDALGDVVNAAKYYEIRSKLPGWDEENFMTVYRLAQATERKGDKWWTQAQNYYLAAYAMRPHRIEPLIKLTEHYLRTGEFGVAYLFIKRACEFTYPDNELLFVEADKYRFVRYDLLGQAAWYIGEYEVGEAAVRKALEIEPTAPHLIRNLKFYTDRKEQLAAKEKIQNSLGFSHEANPEATFA